MDSLWQFNFITIQAFTRTLNFIGIYVYLWSHCTHSYGADGVFICKLSKILRNTRTCPAFLSNNLDTRLSACLSPSPSRNENYTEIYSAMHTTGVQWEKIIEKSTNAFHGL